MVCRRLQYLQLISRAIEEAKMSSPNMNARSFNREECTDPFCDCANCQLKGLSAAAPVKAKSSILSCCGAGRKAKSKEDARSGSPTRAGYMTTTACKCASEGDASLRPLLSGPLATCAVSATSAAAVSAMENCDNCVCGCAEEPSYGEPAREGWFGYIRRPFAYMFSFIPFGRLPQPDIAVTCASRGSAMAKTFSCVVGKSTKVAASAVWTFLMNFIIFLLKVAMFLIDLSMVLLHALTHWYWYVTTFIILPKYLLISFIYFLDNTAFPIVI